MPCGRPPDTGCRSPIAGRLHNPRRGRVLERDSAALRGLPAALFPGSMRAAARGLGCLLLLPPLAHPLVVLSPEHGQFDHVTAGFGPELPASGIAQDVVWASPGDGCRPVAGCAQIAPGEAVDWSSDDPARSAGGAPSPGACAGKILMVRRGNCDFFKKILHSQGAGAAAVVVYGATDTEELITMAAEPDEVGDIRIPSVYVSKRTGESLPGARVVLNATGELPMGDGEPLPGIDSLVSPWRRDHIMPGAISGAPPRPLLPQVR